MQACEFLPFEEVEHTADLCLRVYGEDLKQLFVHAAQGMFHLMQCKSSDQVAPVSRSVAIASYDLETMLVDWLGELLYLSELDQACYTAFEITRLEPTRMEALVGGMTHHPAQRGIKAVTFYDLRITRTATGLYEATVTFDV